MRFIVGIIFGVVLTIGAAYIHDTWAAGPGPGENRQMVNWDVVHQNVRRLGANINSEWSRLTRPLRHET